MLMLLLPAGGAGVAAQPLPGAPALTRRLAAPRRVGTGDRPLPSAGAGREGGLVDGTARLQAVTVVLAPGNNKIVKCLNKHVGKS